MQVTEDTLQFLIKLMGVLAFTIMILVLLTFAVVIVHDGNNAEVQTAFNDMASFAQWVLAIAGGILVLKPVASAVQANLEAHADEARARTNGLNITNSQEVPLKS